MSLKLIIWVGLGGFAGTVLRWMIGAWTLKHLPSGFPYGTLTVNLLGALAIGCLYGFFERQNIPVSDWRSVLPVGVCGGFTTFSAFTMENILLLREGHYQMAIFYIFISLLLGLAMTFGGYMFTRA